MSKETIEWLNENVLMGFTDDREKWAGNGFTFVRDDKVVPWYATADYSNGYSGPVPIEAVETLFGWEAIELPLTYQFPTDDVSNCDGIDEHGDPYRKIVANNKKAIVRSDNGMLLNVTAGGYGVHQYSKWLVDNVAAILDDDVAIASAGLLMGGGVAWVSVSLPETIVTRSDFAIKPGLLACTSHNSKYVTTYKEELYVSVCDNSLDGNMRSKETATFKQKHTANSHLRISDAREALGILHQQADDMVAFIDSLAEWEVTNKDFARLMNTLQPVPEKQIEGGKVTNQRAITVADKRRSDITGLYLKDDRAAPWKGTALGVLQAFNTWDQQERDIKGERVERRMLHTLGDEVAKFDRQVLDTLAAITERELVAA